MKRFSRILHATRRWVVEGAERCFSGGLFPAKERPHEPQNDHRPLVEAIAACRTEQVSARDVEPPDRGHDQRPHGEPQPPIARQANGTFAERVACERAGSVLIASTYRRLQRFFQQVSLPEDWSARLIVRLLGLTGSWHLCLDRTNWKIGARDVNILMLAITTQRFRVPLMWTVLDKAGSSNTEERIALMRRYLALFGSGSVRLLLADREFIGLEWLTFLKESSIPFAIRVKASMIVNTEGGRRLSLQSVLTKCRAARKFQATLPARGDVEAMTLTFAAKRIKGGELLIVASNVAGQNTLNAYRRRWSIECLFGDTETRGLNLEDTRMQTATKLSLLLAIVAIAVAWTNKTASALIGRGKLTRKTHGHYAKSWFRTGFDEVRRLLRSNPIAALDPWTSVPKRRGVV